MQSPSPNWARPLYFLFYAAGAALIPFLVIYYQDLGLAGTQIGLLAGLPALISLFSGPLWGNFQDRTSKKKLILIITFTGAVLMALVISVSRSFYLLIAVVMFFAIFSSPIPPLIDSTVMAELGGKKQKYGQFRMWGAVGWGISAPVIGWLIDLFSIKVSFWAYAALMLAGLLVAMRIQVRGQLGSASKSEFRLFLTDRRWLIFLGYAFTAGIVLAMISNFLFIYLHDLGANELMLGWTLTVATLSEIPVLYFSSRLLKRWAPQQIMRISLFLFAARALAYTFITAPWMGLMIQLLHGPTFSLMWIAGVSYADAIALAGSHSTAQGMFFGVMLGISATVGSIIGGAIYEHTGFIAMFRVAALVALLGGAFFWIMGRRTDETSI